MGIKTMAGIVNKIGEALHLGGYKKEEDHKGEHKGEHKSGLFGGEHKGEQHKGEEHKDKHHSEHKEGHDKEDKKKKEKKKKISIVMNRATAAATATATKCQIYIYMLRCTGFNENMSKFFFLMSPGKCHV